MTRESETHDAEAAGEQYAQEQIESDYFNDWVRSQLAEAARMDPSQVLPLETKDDAREIAKNMLQQLYWDTSRDLEPREIARLIGVDDTTREDVKEFFKGFRDTTNASRDWLADELLRLKGEMRGGVREAPRRRDGSQQRYKPTKGVKLRVVDRILPGPGGDLVEFQDGFRIQVHGGSGRDDLLYAMKPIDMRYEGRSPGPESRREYQYAALRAVLGERPATFLVDRDGDVRATLTESGVVGGVREAARRRPTPTGLLAGMSYEQILSLAHKHRAGSPEEREAIRQAQAYITQRGEKVGEARTRRVEAIHGYDIEVVFSSEQAARKFGPQIAAAMPPFVSQHAIRDGYSLVYGPIERDDYRRLEGIVYSKLGNAARVRLVQRMYAGESSRVSEARRPGTRIDIDPARAPVHIPEAAIEAAKKKYLDDLRAISPGQPEVWYQRQMERQPMFKNPGMYPWQFDLGGRRGPRTTEARRRPKARRPARRR